MLAAAQSLNEATVMVTEAQDGPARKRTPSMWSAGRALGNLEDPSPDPVIAPAVQDTPAADRASPAPVHHHSQGNGPWLLVLSLKTIPEGAGAQAEDGAPMPKPLHHRVAALAFLRARIISGGGTERLEAVECRAGGLATAGERDLLTGFWRAFEEWKPKLVTWNGRGFVLPVLKFRSMCHRLSARYLHEAGDKWSGYNHRYALTHHVDMMDVLSDQHAGPFPSLHEVAECFGIGHRQETEDTAAMLAAGRIEDVRASAEADAAATFSAYVRWRAFTGAMSYAAHDEAVASCAAIPGGRGGQR
jgi:hypothetical protein